MGERKKSFSRPEPNPRIITVGSVVDGKVVGYVSPMALSRQESRFEKIYRMR